MLLKQGFLHDCEIEVFSLQKLYSRHVLLIDIDSLYCIWTPICPLLLDCDYSLVVRRMLLMEYELLTLPEHLSLSTDVGWIGLVLLLGLSVQ